jgi:hypothetical protein
MRKISELLVPQSPRVKWQNNQRSPWAILSEEHKVHWEMIDRQYTGRVYIDDQRYVAAFAKEHILKPYLQERGLLDEYQWYFQL